MEGHALGAPDVGVVPEASRDRRAVDVAVEDRHEDREATLRSGGRLGGVADREHRAVGGRDDDVLAALRPALGVAEELEEEERQEPEKGRRQRMARDDGQDRGGERRQDERPASPGDGDPQLGSSSRR